jgi:hypothetical protein
VTTPATATPAPGDLPVAVIGVGSVTKAKTQKGGNPR